jgi:hypothetical protein
MLIFYLFESFFSWSFISFKWWLLWLWRLVSCFQCIASLYKFVNLGRWADSPKYWSRINGQGLAQLTQMKQWLRFRQSWWCPVVRGRRLRCGQVMLSSIYQLWLCLRLYRCKVVLLLWWRRAARSSRHWRETFRSLSLWSGTPIHLPILKQGILHCVSTTVVVIPVLRPWLRIVAILV